MDKLLTQANSIYDEIVEIRRDIHSHPELGHQETRTSALIRAKLAEYGADEILSPTPTSVVAVIRGRKGDGRTVGLRADIDALPVTEATGLPFASENEGVMHACGHDLHASMMLGNAKILCERRDDFAGTVKIIFEHSEEIQPGGAREILETGVLDDVDAFFGMHVSPTENDRTGHVLLRKGSVTTSADEVYINVHGKGGHGSQPHKAVDAILAACQVNVLLNQIQARNVDPLRTCIMSMNTIEGGIARNVMPGECSMGGSVRAYDPETRAVAHQKIHDICRGVEQISGATIEERIDLGYDACINDDDLVDALIAAYEEGGIPYEMMAEPMGFSEDYSFFSTRTGKPSVLIFLAAGHINEISTLHSATCTFREEAIPYGMAAMTGAALTFLSGSN